MAISTGNSGSSAVNANINVTPMIDVMLVLLIIFMLVTPLLAAGFQATMPAAKHVEASEEKDDEIRLGVDQSGAFFVNGKPVPDADVQAQLTALFAARPEYHLLHFKADANLPYERVQMAIEMARQAGAVNLVAIADRVGGLMPTDDEKEK